MKSENQRLIESLNAFISTNEKYRKKMDPFQFLGQKKAVAVNENKYPGYIQGIILKNLSNNKMNLIFKLIIILIII